MTVSAIGRFFDNMLDALFPRNCVYCEGARENGGPFLCGPCREDVVFINGPYCNRCGVPADISYDYPHESFECGPCRRGNFVFDQARSLGVYDSVLKQLIRNFKYGKRSGAIREVDSLLDEYFSRAGDTYRGFGVVPVPLHVRKLKERGFDQAYLIAQSTARRLGLPLWDRVLTRVRETEPQARKDKGHRRENVRGAFRMDRAREAAGRDILLVDDVFTTGSTVNEIAKVLKKAGAGRVHVFTLARA